MLGKYTNSKPYLTFLTQYCSLRTRVNFFNCLYSSSMCALRAPLAALPPLPARISGALPNTSPRAAPPGKHSRGPPLHHFYTAGGERKNPLSTAPLSLLCPLPTVTPLSAALVALFASVVPLTVHVSTGSSSSSLSSPRSSPAPSSLPRSSPLSPRPRPPDLVSPRPRACFLLAPPQLALPFLWRVGNGSRQGSSTKQRQESWGAGRS